MKVNLIEKQIVDNKKAFDIKDYIKCCNSFIDSKIACIAINEDYKPEAQINSLEEWDYDQFTDVEETISFCPFCGAKIEVIIDAKIDYSVEYNDLVEKLNKLKKQLKVEDSLKTRKELELKLNETIKKIDNLFCSNLIFKNLED